MIVKLELPEPPSANRYWRMARGRLYASSEAKAYKAEVVARAIRAGYRTATDLPFPKGISIVVRVEWHRSRRAGDLDNRLKIVMDALNGVLWADDMQVVEIHAYRYDAPRAGALHLLVEDAPTL